MSPLDTWAHIETFGIRYLAPFDLQSAPIEPGSIDCFYTMVTLEHIPPTDLQVVLRH